MCKPARVSAAGIPCRLGDACWQTTDSHMSTTFRGRRLKAGARAEAWVEERALVVAVAAVEQTVAVAVGSKADDSEDHCATPMPHMRTVPGRCRCCRCASHFSQLLPRRGRVHVRRTWVTLGRGAGFYMHNSGAFKSVVGCGNSLPGNWQLVWQALSRSPSALRQVATSRHGVGSGRLGSTWNAPLILPVTR